MAHGYFLAICAGCSLLWNIDTGGRVRRFDGHNGAIRSVAWNADGTEALSASVDGTVRVWDVDSEREIQRFVGHESTVQQAAFLPEHIVSAGVDGTVRVWDRVTGDEVRRYSATDSAGLPVGLDTLAVNHTEQVAICGLARWVAALVDICSQLTMTCSFGLPQIATSRP